MVYINKKHSITKISSLNDLSKHIDTTWGLAIINGKRYIIGSVYLKLNYSPGIDELMSMMNSAYELQNQLKASGVIVCGDLNARHSAWGDYGQNEYGKKLFEKVDKQKFSIHTARSPTFVAANGGSFIDLIIISNNLQFEAITCNTDEVVELYSGAPLRGHLPVITKLTNGTVNRETADEPKETLNLENVNWDDWSRDLENKVVESSNRIMNTQDPHEMWDLANNMIQDTTKKHAEKKN